MTKEGKSRQGTGEEQPIDPVQTMSPEERARYFDQHVAEIVEYCYKHSPAFKERMDKAGIKPAEVQKVEDLDKIPIMTREALVERQRANPPFGGMLTCPLSDLKRIFISPGPHYHPQSEDVFSVPDFAYLYYTLGFRKGDIVLNSIMYHLVPAGTVYDDALKYLGVVVIPTGVGNSELQVEIMRETKATGFIGTPSFLMTLLQKIKGKGYDFRKDFALRKAILAHELVLPELKQTLARDYGISVGEFYGTADGGLLCCECEYRNGMHALTRSIVEIVDPETKKKLKPGEIGEIVYTALSKTYSLIRVGTGDLSSFAEGSCPCGRTSPRITRILGRVGTTTKIRGMFVYASQVEKVVAQFPQISNFQLVVDSTDHRDRTILKVEVSEGTDKKTLEQDIKASFNEICNVKLDAIELVALGTISKERKVILDQRKWG